MRRTQVVPNETLMEHAIQKASKLIALLQEQNQDLKQKLTIAQKTINQNQSKLNSVSRSNTVFKNQKQSLQSRIVSLQKQINISKQQLEKLQLKLASKSNNNKQIHEKLSVLTVRNKQLTQQMKEHNKKYLSLQNQNQYLYKQLQKHVQKQNEWQKNLQLKDNTYYKQLSQGERTKQAFSRRCEELKNECAMLRKVIAQESLKGSECLAANQQLHGRVLSLETDTNEYRKVKEQITRLVEIHVGIKPASTLNEQIDQLCNFVNYRLEHIAKLCQDILAKVGKEEWRTDAKARVYDVHVSVQRLANYLNQII